MVINKIALFSKKIYSLKTNTSKETLDKPSHDWMGTGWTVCFQPGDFPSRCTGDRDCCSVQLPWPLKNLSQDLGHLLFFACISQFFPPYAVTTSPLTVCSFWPASLSSERQQTLWILFPPVCVFPLNFSLLYFCLSKRRILTFLSKTETPNYACNFFLL